MKLHLNSICKPILNILLAAGCVAGCGQEKNNTGTDSIESTDHVSTTTDTTSVTSSELKVSDTLSISGRTVVFFGPSESVIEILKKKEPNRNVAQESLKFSEAMNPVMDSLTKAGFESVQYTEKQFIQVTLRTGTEMKIDRFKLKSEFGMYMTDGIQPPALKLGVLTTNEMHSTLKKFFNP